MLAADGYTQLVAARMFDFFNRHAPWHLALWSIGTALAMDEVAEYSELTKMGAFTTKDGLKYVAESTRTVVGTDPALDPPELRDAVLAALEDRVVATDAGVATLRHLADRVRDGYLPRLADAARAADPPGVERLASAAASHLLDVGFSAAFLHDWLRHLAKVDDRQLSIAQVLDEAGVLCSSPPNDYEVVIPFIGVPGGYPGPMPAGWLTGQETKNWLAEHGPTPEGDLRQSGSVLLATRARDPWSAVETAAEAVAQVSARAAVGSRLGRLRAKGVGWIAGHERSYPLHPRTRVQLRSLKTSAHVFELALDPAAAVVNDAIEIFSALESGTRGAALTGGWAAVEGLLLRPGEGPHVLAADRLATIIACAFPRAELTTLSHRHRPAIPDALTASLVDVTVNLERCRIVEDSIRAGHSPVVRRPSDQALVKRVDSMIAYPAEKLGNVRRYVGDTLRRLYTQRNLIMHAGSFQSVTLRATLRTAPSLVAAGVDRVVGAQLGDRRTDPLALAARAETELGLLGTPAQRRLCDLLE